MPDTPIEDARVAPQVSPGAGLPMDATPQSFGAGIGESVQGLGAVAAELHAKARTYADRSAVLDADNQTNAFLNERLYNAQTGLLHQNPGRGAPAAVDQTLSDYDEHVSKVAEGLSDIRQRQAYQHMAQNRRLDLDRQLGEFEHKETTRDADEVDKAAVTSNAAAAVLNANDPLIIGKSVGHIQEVIASAGERKGTAPEAIKEQQQIAASQVYTSVIGKLVDAGDTASARRSFDQWGDQLTPADQHEVRGLLKISGVRSESRELSDTIIGSLGDSADLQGALEDLEKRKIDNVDVYDQTRNRLTEHFRLVNEAENQRQAGLYDDATGYIDTSVNPTSPDTIPPTVWDRMKPAYKRKVMAYAAARAKGQEIVTPRGLYAALEQQKARDPQAFAKRNLLLEPLSTKDFEKYAAEQAAISKGDEKLIAKFQTTGEVIDQVLLQGGITPAKSGKKQGDDEIAFMDQLGKAVTAEQQATGKEVGQARLAEIGKQLMQAVVLKRARTNPVARFFDEIDEDNFTHAFQSPISQKLAYSFAQVPQDAAAKHRHALEAAGFQARDITDEMIRQRYNEDLVEAYRRGE